MAISTTISTEHGLSVSNAYIRIESVTITKASAHGFITIHTDRTKPSFQARPICFDYQIDGPNPIKQAYLHLKSLPEFSDAEDC